MTGPTANAFDAFCRRAFDFLNDAKCRYLVVGGLAVVAVGEPRTTADVDVIAFLSDSDARGWIARASIAGFEVVPELELQRLQSTGTLRFRQGPFQLDIILASLPFEDEALARSVRRKMFDREVPLPTPEDLLLFKILAGRDKDLIDSVGIVKRHRLKFDWPYVESVVQELCDLAEDMAPWHRLELVRRKAELL